mgnify:CR=1 FL=1
MSRTKIALAAMFALFVAAPAAADPIQLAAQGRLTSTAGGTVDIGAYEFEFNKEQPSAPVNLRLVN